MASLTCVVVSWFGLPQVVAGLTCAELTETAVQQIKQTTNRFDVNLTLIFIVL